MTSAQPPTMGIFEIPTGPPITERGGTYLVSKSKRGKSTSAPYGSITYNRKRGDMLEWDNEDEFLVWLAAEETKNTIKLIVSHTEKSNSPNWRARRLYRCSWEFSGGQVDRANANHWDRKIPSKKTGCGCRLVIKQYPGTDTMLGKYEGKHDHPLGDDNLRFLRLSENTRNLVMEMIHTRIDPKAIVSNKLHYSLTEPTGCLGKTCARFLQADRSRLPHYHAGHQPAPSDR